MFDFDATLPLMAVQFLLLVALLNAVFYKPLTKAIEDRSDYIRTNETEARERLAKAEHLAAQYEQELAASRKQYQQTIASAQQEAQAQREQVQRELDQQKQEAMQSLEQQVESLSHQILDKLLVRS